MAEKSSKNNRGMQRLLLIILFAVVAIAIGVTFALTYINQMALAGDRSIEVGDEFLAAEEYAEAEKVYLSVDGMEDRIHNRLLNLYTRWANSLIAAKSEPDTIIEILEKLVTCAPDNMDAYYVMASLYRADDDIPAAIAACDRALSVDGANDKLIRYKGTLLLQADLRPLAAEHYEKYAASTGSSKYADLALSLYPATPHITAESGNYSEYFNFDIFYEEPTFSNPAAAPVDVSDVKIYYTVDGTLPTPDAPYASPSGIPTFEYTDSIDASLFHTGNTLVITAVAVDKYGMMSQPAVAEYTFDVDYAPVTSVKLSKTSIKLEEDEQTTLRVTLNPGDATNKNVIWKSSDENFVTVDENGFVTAVHFTANENLDIRTTTETTVTVTVISLSSGLSASCEVTVVPSKTTPSTSYNSSKKYLEVGLKAMQEVNPHVVGYIKLDNVEGVPNLPHCPIYFNESDPDFYLTHNGDGAESGYGTVTVPAGVRLSSLGRNTVIVANYVPSGENEDDLLLSTVADIDQYPSWYLNGKNHYVYVNTVDGAYIFQTFSWYHPDGSFTDYAKTDFATMDEFIDFCNDAEDANQLYNTASPRFYGNERILTLIIYKDGEVYSVMHGRVARYKSLTTGVPAFFDDDLDGYDEPVEPETPVDPEIPEEPVDPEVPETPVDPEAPVEPETPEEPVGIEGDLDGDGKLSFTEKYLLDLKKQREEEAAGGAEGSEDTETEEGSDE